MEKDMEASIVPIIQAMGGSRDNIVEIIEQDETSTVIDKENQSVNIMNSTNNNNMSKRDSLTHSQISMISKNNDHGSHLYSTPESIANGDEKHTPEVLVTKESMMDNVSQITTTKTIPHLPMLPPGLPGKETPKQKRKFPTMILLGSLQLILSIILAALGGLVIARNAALCMTFSGIWAGAIAGVTGSLAIINVKSAQTGFLASSLVSVATGTLALSLTGIGLLRDWNVIHQDEKLYAAVQASAGLLFTLSIHLVTSIISVYYSALTMCGRKESHHMENLMYADMSRAMENSFVGDYINTLPLDNEVKEKMYQDFMSTTLRNDKDLFPPFVHPLYQPQLLIPARQNTLMYPPPIYTPNLMFPQSLLPPGASSVYGQSTLPRDVPKLHRKRSSRSLQEKHSQRRRSRSESDDQKKRDARSAINYTYTGLDRKIAENYLAHQEKSLSHSINDNISAKCNDVQM